MASYLFILATDVLNHMLDDTKYKVEGLTLPKRGCVRDQTFANDTVFYFKGNQSNMVKMRTILDLFCLASGRKSIGGSSPPFGLVKKKETGNGVKR